jgi:hypothetical protein
MQATRKWATANRQPWTDAVSNKRGRGSLKRAVHPAAGLGIKASGFMIARLPDLRRKET